MNNGWLDFSSNLTFSKISPRHKYLKLYMKDRFPEQTEHCVHQFSNQNRKNYFLFNPKIRKARHSIKWFWMPFVLDFIRFACMCGFGYKKKIEFQNEKKQRKYKLFYFAVQRIFKLNFRCTYSHMLLLGLSLRFQILNIFSFPFIFYFAQFLADSMCSHHFAYIQRVNKPFYFKCDIVC